MLPAQFSFKENGPILMIFVEVQRVYQFGCTDKQFKQGWFFTIYEVTNVVCESQSCKADNEHIEASMPA